MVIELQIISDLLSKPDKTGKSKVVRKDVLINRLFDINEIQVEEYLNPKNGKPIRKYSGIFEKDSYYKINKPYEELKDLKINRTYPVKGFMGHSLKYKAKQSWK